VEFSTLATVAGTALLVSCLGTAAHVVLRAPLPKGVDASDAAARAAHALAKRQAAGVGLRALAAASAASLALSAGVVGGFRAVGIESGADFKRAVRGLIHGGQ